MIGRVDQLQQVQQTTQTGQVTVDERTAERLRGLNSGDTISGRVVNITTDAMGNRTAQVDLGNGATVNARLAANMALQTGENISFTVRSNASNALTLSPLYTNTAANSTINAALSQAGLLSNDTLTEMVRAMMNEGMSIDRNSLLQMSASLNDFPNVNVTTLVHMSHLNVPLVESNIEMFTAYENYEHQVVSGMEQIFDALPDSFNALLQQEDFGTAMDMYGDVMELFAEGAESLAEEGSVTALPEDNAAQVFGTGVTGELAGAEKSVNGEQTPLQGTDALQAAIRAAAGLPEEGSENAEAVKASADKVQAAGEIAAQNLNAADKGGAETSGIRFSKAFVDLLKELNVSQNTIQSLVNGVDGGKDAFSALLKELSETYARTAHTSEEVDRTWTNLFSTKEYNAVLKEAISSQWLLKPEEVADKQNVENLYRRLNAQTKALTDILQNTAGADAKVTQSVNTLAKNIDFISDLNQMYNYVQLPLKLQGDNAHGDLYVYRNKNKSMADADGETSAFLHLDMDNLGPVDVLVKLKDNDVTTNFTLADDAAMDLIEAHVDELEARIQKRGYKVKITTGLKEEDASVNPVVDRLLQVSTDKTPVFIGAFDARA